MKQSVSCSEFVDAFRAYDRYDQFGYRALHALFDYLEEYEDDTGQEVELDVIALCCDYTVYNNLAELNKDYDGKEYTLDTLRDETTVIEVPNSEQLIVQAF